MKENRLLSQQLKRHLRRILRASVKYNRKDYFQMKFGLSKFQAYWRF